MLNDILFYALSAVAVGAGLALVCARNPLTGALCLLSTILATAGLFGLLDAWFLAIVEMLVYGGAVIVLFLFVIMLVDVESAPRLRFGFGGWAVAALCFLMLAVILTATFLNISAPVPQTAPEVSALASPENAAAYATSVKAYGQLLFTKYMLPFQLTGVLLLVAMLGVIVLSRRMGADGRILSAKETR